MPEPLITFCDLKPGETLSIGEGRITLQLQHLNPDGSARVEVSSPLHRGRRLLASGQYMRLDDQTGLFNYGNRHHGRRIHLRIEFRNQELPPIKILPAPRFRTEPPTFRGR